MRWILYTILLGLVITAAGAAWLAFSTPGARWILGLLNRTDYVRIDAVDGTLAGSVRAGRLVVHTETIRVEIDELAVDLAHWRSLLANVLVADRVSAARVRIEVASHANSTPQPLRISLPRLPFAIQARAVAVGSVTINELPAALTPSVHGRFAWREAGLTFGDAVFEAPEYRVMIDGSVGAVAPHAVRGAVAWRYRDFAGTAALAGNLERLEVDHVLGNPVPATTRGTVELLGRLRPRADLVSVLAEYHRGDLAARRIELSLAGDLDRYTGVLDANLAYGDALDGHLHGTFEGDLAGVAISAARFDSDAGIAEVSGTVAFAPPHALALTVRVPDLDPRLVEPWTPAVLRDELQGRLSAYGAISGSAEALRADGLRIDGSLGGAPVSAQGTLQQHDGRWETPGIDLRWGANETHLEGFWSPTQVEANASVAIMQPELADERFTGEASARIRVSGPPAGLRVEADMDIPELAFEQLTARELAGSLTFEKGYLSRVRIERGKALVANMTLERLRGAFGRQAVSARGSLSWSIEDRDGRLSATASRFNGVWDIHLDEAARLALPQETLILDRTADVRWSALEFDIGAHCWRREGPGELCIEQAHVDPGTFDAIGHIDDLPVASVIQTFAPGVPDVTGTLNGRWSIRRVEQSLSGFAELETTGLGLAADADESVALPDLRARLDLAGDRIDATLAAGTGERSLDGTLAVTRLFDTPQLEATLNGAADLSFASQLSRRLGTVSGQVTTRLNATGPLRNPVLTGDAQLSAERVESLDPHIELENLNVSSRLTPEGSLVVTGHAQSGGGEVRIEARLTDALHDERALSGQLTTTRVKVESPDAVLLTSAALGMTISSGAVKLNGEVQVPYARVALDALPPSVKRLSDDVVVVNRPPEPTNRTRLTADVTVHLGNDVRFNGYGLDTGLSGDLRLRQTPQGEVRVNGQVSLVDGTFEAFGQSLDLESGSLSYTGPPSRPYVDARAVRTIRGEVDDVRVGIHIRGPADAIESELFSQPALSDGDALSYLLTGRPLDDASSAEGEQLSGAAIGLGLATAAPVINEIRQHVGLEELGAKGNGEDLTLIAGKRVSNKVFIRYTYRAFARLSAFVISYDLTRRLSLEATASETPGTDLIYRVGDR